MPTTNKEVYKELMNKEFEYQGKTYIIRVSKARKTSPLILCDAKSNQHISSLYENGTSARFKDFSFDIVDIENSQKIYCILSYDKLFKEINITKRKVKPIKEQERMLFLMKKDKTIQKKQRYEMIYK